MEPRQWFMSKPGHRDCFTVARALRSLLQPAKKGPQMSETADGGRVDPHAQIDRWIRQYCVHVKAPDVAKALDFAASFRIARTMILQDKQLTDVEAILKELAKDNRKPRGVGWLITVIEGKLGKVA